MSFSAIAWALEQGRDRGLPTAERMLLVALANALNEKTGRCDPGQACLRAGTGLTERHIRDLAVSLVRRGLVQIMKVGRALHYRLLRDAAPQQETGIPEPSSAVIETIPEHAAAIVDTIQEPVSGNGKDDTGTWTPKYRNPVPTIPETSSAQPIREPRETGSKRPVAPQAGRRADATSPRILGTNPRATGTNPRRSGNYFADLKRQLAAEDNRVTIDATAEDVVDFQAFHQRLRIAAHG